MMVSYCAWYQVNQLLVYYKTLCKHVFLLEMSGYLKLLLYFNKANLMK